MQPEPSGLTTGRTGHASARAGFDGLLVPTGFSRHETHRYERTSGDVDTCWGISQPVLDRDSARLRGLGGDVSLLGLFDEHRRETDENRFWFWNSMHFPFPMPAFDMVEVDHPYYTLGGWQNRVFAVPPAMGIDYRVVNGYVYISANPVTDPAKIAERAEFFQRRAGYYFENWDEALRSSGAPRWRR